MDVAARWKDKVALVTGASSGIGRAIALALAKDGLKVAACARRLDRLESLAAEAKEHGGVVLPLQADLRNTGEISVMFDRVRDEWDRVDVLINNAGLGRAAPLMDGDTESWREMLEVNVLALCVATREALLDMTDDDAGHIIHISSMAAHRVPEGSGVYSATKHAVKALTEALRQELRLKKSAIRVTSISPGFVETEFAYQYHRGDEERAKQTYAQFKVLESEDVAEAVRYVLSQPEHVEINDVLMRPTAQRS